MRTMSLGSMRINLPLQLHIPCSCDHSLLYIGVYTRAGFSRQALPAMWTVAPSQQCLFDSTLHIMVKCSGEQYAQASNQCITAHY